MDLPPGRPLPGYWQILCLEERLFYRPSPLRGTGAYSLVGSGRIEIRKLHRLYWH